MNSRVMSIVAAGLCAVSAFIVIHAADDRRDKVKAIVDAAIRPPMEKSKIPGMAVGIIAGGQIFIFEYGVASAATREIRHA